MGAQGSQAIVLEHDVVVDESQVFAARQARAKVVRLGERVVGIARNHPHRQTAFGLSGEREALIGRAVVDEDDLDRDVPNHLRQRIEQPG